MEKSLFELLQEEKKCLSDVLSTKERSTHYKQMAETYNESALALDSYDPEEQVRKEERELLSGEYMDLFVEWELKVEKAEHKLLEIRKELKQYLSFLMEIE